MKHLPADETVYTKEEREEAIQKMRAVSDRFYAGAVHTKVHPFIEFCGLMNEYITICAAASEQGIDFTQANRHSGMALPIKLYHANYIGEKLGCIYGPSFSDPEIFEAFVAALGLPFKVTIEAEPAQEAATSGDQPVQASTKPALSLRDWFNTSEGQERLRQLAQETKAAREKLCRAAYVPDELLKKHVTF